MQVSDLTLEVRDRNLNRVGQITPAYLNLKARLVWCGVGEWSLTLPASHPMVPYLQEPGSGVILRGPIGTTVENSITASTVEGVIFSGPTTTPLKLRNLESPQGTFTFSGVTDEVLLAGALAFPDPQGATGDDPAAQTKANDTRTGTIEALMRQYVAYNTANGALSSPPVTWAKPGRLRGLREFLRLQPTNQDRGATATKSPRFQNLLVLLRELVALDPSLGFRVAQNGSVLEFQVLDSRDKRPYVRFDIDNGSLTSEEVTIAPPTVTWAVAAGQGEGTARQMIVSTDPDATAAEEEWGLVYEVFLDHSNTNNETELAQAGEEALYEGRGGVQAKVIPAENQGMEYGRDWLVGDQVTTVVSGIETANRVTEAVILANSEGVRVGAALGDVSGFAVQDAQAAKVESLDDRVARLERKEHAGVGAATSSPTPSTLVKRDAAGRAQFVDPSAAQDAATKAYVDLVKAIVSTSSGAMGLADRLGPFAKVIDDWNDAVHNGWYMDDAALNAPATGWVIGHVEAHNASWVTQTVHRFTADANDGDTQTYRRHMNNGTWTAWIRLRLSETEQASLFMRHVLTAAGSAGKTFHDVLRWQSPAASSAGSLVIDTPITFGNYMTRIAIRGFDYQNGMNVWDVDAGFYAYNSGPAFARTTVKVDGPADVTGVRFARNTTTGTVALVIDKTSAWQYPAFTIETVDISHVSPPDSFQTGWSATFSTDLAGYDLVTSAPAGAIQIFRGHTHNAATDLTGTLPNARFPTRLQEVAGDVSNTDLNALISTGWYRGQALTNSPDGTGWFYIQVIQHSNVWVYQRAIGYTGSGQRETWERQQISGTWDAWRRVYHYDTELDARYSSHAEAAFKAQSRASLADVEAAGYTSYDFTPEELGIKWLNDFTHYTSGGWDGVKCRQINGMLMIYGVMYRNGASTGLDALQLPPNLVPAGEYQSSGTVQLRSGAGGWTIRPVGTISNGGTVHTFIIVPMPKPQPSSPPALTLGAGVTSSLIDTGWACNQINATPFRKSPLATQTISGTEYQFAAYYNSFSQLVVARRATNSSTWSKHVVTLWPEENYDAHNSISIAVDGAGHLHLAWTSHSGAIHYARTTVAGDHTTLATKAMVGTLEDVTTYPEFYRLSNGDLLFLYRYGVSGDGQAVLNKYTNSTGTWTRLSDNLISGEGVRSAYWQAIVDSQDRLHISWTWRETGDVATNHDIAYMRATSNANTAFVRADGSAQTIPATQANSVKAATIAQNSALMNQTTMAVDGADNPVIASYWRVNGAVQYHIVRWTGSAWLVENLNARWSDFTLGGAGTKSVPIARPLVLASGSGTSIDIRLIIRDEEAGGKLEMLRRTTSTGSWVRTTLVNTNLHAYEPCMDLQAYRFVSGRRHLFVQDMWQMDGEGLQFYPKQNAYVISVP